MSDKIKPVSVPLKFSIPTEDAAASNAVINSLEVSRPKTRHIIQLAALLGPDLAPFLSGADNAADKVAALKENTDFAALFTSLVKLETLNGLLEVLADLCGITTEQAGEIDPVDQVEVFKALFGFFPALKSLTS